LKVADGGKLNGTSRIPVNHLYGVVCGDYWGVTSLTGLWQGFAARAKIFLSYLSSSGSGLRAFVAKQSGGALMELRQVLFVDADNLGIS
jgi:hypothetical protein